MRTRNILAILLIGFMCLAACGSSTENIQTEFTTEKDVEDIVEFQTSDDTEISEKYHIERIDNSLKNTLGAKVVECYYDKVIIDDPEYEDCNVLLEKDASDFISGSDEFLEEAESIGKESDYNDGNFPYYYTCIFKHIEFVGDYVSIRMEGNWFEGGTSESDIVSLNMDKSGKKITLVDVLNIPEEECLEMAYNTTVNFLRFNGYYDEESVEYLKSYKISDYNFYLEDGVCYLCFYKYEVTYGAAGSLAIEIGTY